MYETVEARCGACIVKGGSEAKCVGKEWETVIGGPLGKACPRVELMPELYPVAEILEFAMSERLRPSLGLRAEIVGEVNGYDSEDLHEALSLVSAALSDVTISRILNPAPVKV